MIITFPMIVSPSIPEEFIVPIAKMLERYILIKKLDKFFSIARNMTKTQANFYFKRVVTKMLEENENILEESGIYDELVISSLLSEDIPLDKRLEGEDTTRSSPYDTSRVSKSKIGQYLKAKEGLEKYKNKKLHLDPATVKQYEKTIRMFELEKEHRKQTEDLMRFERMKDKDKWAEEERELRRREAELRQNAQEIQNIRAQIERQKLDLEHEKNRTQREKDRRLLDVKEKELEIKEKEFKNKLKKYEIDAKLDAERLKKMKEDREREAKSVEVRSLNMSTDLALEPTFMTIKFKDGNELLGIKVVPFFIKSDVPLISLLMADAKITGISAALQSIKRKILGAFYRYKIFLKRRFSFGLAGGTKELTGNPKHDIIYSATKYRKRLFVLIDANEVNPDFFKNSANIRRLFKLGWSNLLFFDDVHKRVYFCMKDDKGLCNSLSLPAIFSTLGNRENLYNSLEDARTATTPFFRAKIPSKKILGENDTMVNKKINKKIEEYRNSILDESVMLDENMISDFFDKVKNISIKNFFKDFFSITKSADKEKELTKVSKKYNNLPPVSEGFVNRVFSKIDRGYESNRQYAFNVLKNTLKGTPAKITNEELQKFSTMIASAGAVRSKIKGDSSKNETKKVLMKIGDRISEMSPEQLGEIRKFLNLGVIIAGIAMLKKPLFDFLNHNAEMEYALKNKEVLVPGAEVSESHGGLKIIAVAAAFILFAFIISFKRGKND